MGIQAGRKATRSGLLWGLVFGLYVAVQTLAYTSAYKTQAARHALESAYGGNLGLNALIGPARAIGTVAGYAAWRLLGVLSILGAIWDCSPRPGCYVAKKTPGGWNFCWPVRPPADAPRCRPWWSSVPGWLLCSC